ncbi:MAG: hypothetical protein GXP62_21910 [Oligoflexia bacterium]|nr:hypothetical protein [Oligoflexia bacterium]
MWLRKSVQQPSVNWPFGTTPRARQFQKQLPAAVHAALREYQRERGRVCPGDRLKMDAPADIVELLPVLLADAAAAVSAWSNTHIERDQWQPDLVASLLRTIRDERLDLQLAVARWRLARVTWGPGAQHGAWVV